MKRIRVAALAVMLAIPTARATTNLADQPVFTATAVPGNMMFVMSVEYPTGDARAYPDTNDYTSASSYIGYFNPTTCYTYTTAANSTNGTGYFSPYGPASSHVCSSTSSVHLWSGNYLNWSSMSAIDEFRSALTGGYRVVDTTSQTIVERAWEDGQAGSGDDPNTSITGQSTIAGATPFSNWTTLQTSTLGLGNQMVLTMSGTLGSSTNEYNGQVPSTSTSNSCSNCAKTVYMVTVRIKVCSSSSILEGDCTTYKDSSGNVVSYKPEGLIQKNYVNMRYGVESYLNDSNSAREGGVLRARMAYVGPTMPSVSDPTTMTTNPNPEWNSANGIFYTNPDPADATATQSANAGTTISNSGVINYLNKFGEGAGSGYSGNTHYKSGDNLSELYYAALRYMKYQGNISQYSANSGIDSTSTTQMLDGFPDIQTPNTASSNGATATTTPNNSNDPILYACQKNFFLGIGDTNTHFDSTLPGSTVSSSGYGQTTYAAITADTSINLTTATSQVGAMEGMGSGIGGKTLPQINSNNCCDTATAYVAGMAFDAHVNDMRPSDFKNADGSKSYTQTLSTFWLDVQEYQRYTYNDQYYLATKYGGFTGSVSAYTGYTASSSLTAPATTTWHTTSNTQYDSWENQTNLQPDNYFNAGQAQTMVTGLTTAFANIAKQVAASSTAFAVSSPKLQGSGNVSYGSVYDPNTWTGDVDAYNLSFDASGNPSTSQVWSAQTKLGSQSPSSRIIATCCTGTSSSEGLPFEATNLGATLATQYATFANVSGVSASNQSSANYLAWLRGDRTQELANGGAYRTRTAVLGDVTDSKVNPVGAPSQPFSEAHNPGYTAFESTWSTRPTVVYVGANDGMMHAFDGSITDSTAGHELFAYVPSAMYGSTATAPTTGLASLGVPSNFVHHNFVDATPENFDIDLNKTQGQSGTSPNWHSLLIGGLGKGGDSYYAIDVTNPAGVTTETALASDVLWEFTDSTMGYSYGDPTVVKTAQYGWVIILTSGYNNSSSTGYIYIVNPKTGALIQRIAVGSGADGLSSDGLAYGSGYVLDYSDGTADSYYVGDVNGHVWRLDLTPTSGGYSAPTEVAELKDASGNAQPITTRPLIEIDPSSLKRYVLIGTGKLLASTDITTDNQQTFYAIMDGTASAFNTAATLPNSETFPLVRADMVNDSSTLTTGIGSAPSVPSGWYVDLQTSSSGGASERIDVTPTANYGIVAFAANTPQGNACSPSGTNRIFGVAFGLGKSVLVNTAGTIIASSSSLSGVATDIEITNVAGSLRITAGTSTGLVANVPGTLSTSTSLKQLNWIEVPSAD